MSSLVASVEHIVLLCSLSSDGFFQSIPSLTFSTYYFALSSHLSFGLPSGSFPSGPFSSTDLSNEPSLPAYFSHFLVMLYVLNCNVIYNVYIINHNDIKNSLLKF